MLNLETSLANYQNVSQFPLAKRMCQVHGEYTPLFQNSANQCQLCGEDLIRRADEAERARFEAEARLTYARNYNAASELPDALLGTMLTDIAGSCQSHDAMINRLIRYVQNFELVKERKISSVLQGISGTGKTTMLVALTNQLRTVGVGAVYITQMRLGEKYRDTVINRESESEFKDKYRTAEVMILDDLGTGSGSESECRIIGDIIFARHEHGRPTIISTNLKPEDLKKEFGTRVSMRMAYWKILNCDWNPLRRIAGGWE